MSATNNTQQRHRRHNTAQQRRPPPPQRPHERGLLASLFFGRARAPPPPRVPTRFHKQVDDEVYYDNDEETKPPVYDEDESSRESEQENNNGPTAPLQALRAGTRIPTPPPSTPVFQSELPTPIEVCNAIAGVGTVFTLQRPTTPEREEDIALRLALQQLCFYFLGGPAPQLPSSPSAPIPQPAPRGGGQRPMSVMPSAGAGPFDYVTAAYAGLPPRRNLTASLQAVVDPSVASDSIPAADVAMFAPFYPRLMLILQGVMKRLYSFDLLVQPTSMEHHGLHQAWDAALGGLDLLRIVLLHAEAAGIASYGAMPREWAAIVKENVSAIQRSLESIHATELELAHNKEQMSACSEKIIQIHSSYAAPCMTEQLLRGRHAREKAALDFNTSVVAMLKSAPLTLPRPPEPPAQPQPPAFLRQPSAA